MKLTIIKNKDENKVAAIREALRDNDGYCPCTFVKDETTKCICEEFREQNTPGLCHCGLYEKILL